MVQTQCIFFVFLIISGLVMASQCSQLASATDASFPGPSEIDDQGPSALDELKRQLKEKSIFDPDSAQLTPSQKKELEKLFAAVDIMLGSRARQPNSAQGAFASLRTLQRALDKQLKDGLISRSLYNEFQWSKLSSQES